MERGRGLRCGRPSWSQPQREKQAEAGPSKGLASGSTTPTPKKVELAAAVVTKSAAESEVILNSRGMPFRQRKKNPHYFDEEIMMTPGTMAKSKACSTRIKAEPVDTEEDDPSSYHFELPSSSGMTYSPAGSAKPKGRPRKTEGTVAVTPIKPASVEGAKAARSRSAPPMPKSPRGRGKKSGEGEKHKEKKESGKKQREVPKSTPVESQKKPKMQFIRIKREPDMRFAAPELVVQPDHESGSYERFEDGMIKRDYSDSLINSAALRNHFGYDGYGATPSKLVNADASEGGRLDHKTAHDMSIRLRNLLKLPKAHKWVCYEWFYSNIDKVLFEGENDFQICLTESFPQLKTRKMTRVEWCKVRRLMGKPRRCSQSFFDEEREELIRRRQKIRMIQQRKVTDFNYKELPDEIPLLLVVGTKVTSRLRKPQDGLFTGIIDGVDTSNNTYRITFDRPGLGTHSIPDYEVLANDPPETVSSSSFSMKIPRRIYRANGTMGEGSKGFPKSPFPLDGKLGGFPIRLLEMIVRLSKLLKGKREKILQLRELNVEAEKLVSYGKSFNDDFRIRYARVVVDLELMNKEMGMYLEGIQQYCLEITPDQGANQMIIPEHVQETCRQEASILVDTQNTNKNRNKVQGTKAIQLITDMASLLLQVKALSIGDRSLYELKSIQDALSGIKASLGGRNLELFQDRVEIPMNRIQTGLTLPAHK